MDSFRRLLKNAGFRVDQVLGFGPPLADLSGGQSKLLGALDGKMAWLARRWPWLFAYQILIECTRTDSPTDLMRQVFPQVLVSQPQTLKAAASARTQTVPAKLLEEVPLEQQA